MSSRLKENRRGPERALDLLAAAPEDVGVDLARAGQDRYGRATEGGRCTGPLLVVEATAAQVIGLSPRGYR
jgi:hypothetical protein